MDPLISLHKPVLRPHMAALIKTFQSLTSCIKTHGHLHISSPHNLSLMGLGACRELCNENDGKMLGVKLRRRRRRRQRAVQMKVKKLQRIVPGGDGLQPDSLFVQTANYILHLRLQVYALQSIYSQIAPDMTSSIDLKI